MENPTSNFWAARKRAFIWLLLAVLVFAVALSGLVFVDQTELVIVEHLGAISVVYDQTQDRGLHFKWPYPLETTRRFDRRVRLLNLPAREILTRDKKNITLDAYVCWKIAEPDGEEERPVVRFFRALGDAKTAEAQLESRLNSLLSARFAQVELDALFDDQHSESGPQDDSIGLLEQLAKDIKTQASSQWGGSASAAKTLQSQLGIEIVEVGFQRLNFPDGNRAAVYERMRSQRRKIAERYRAEGLAESQVIKSQAELWAKTLLARANADAERIKGQAEADAARVLNTAYEKDREFARVLRTLDGYRKILHPETTLVLSASSRVFRLLTLGPDSLEQTPKVGEQKTESENQKPGGME